MVNKNRYYSRSKITEAKFRQLVRCFALDFTASSTAELTGISVRSMNTVYLKIRQRLAESCEQVIIALLSAGYACYRSQNKQCEEKPSPSIQAEKTSYWKHYAIDR